MDKPMTPDQFKKLVDRTNHENPSQKDLAALRSALTENPALLEVAGDLARQSQHLLVYQTPMSEGAREFVVASLEKLSRELGASHSPALERLAIDQILICYLRLNLWEYAYHGAFARGGMSLKQAQEWEKLIGSAQRRYIRAIESLARLRKLGINIQVNIATDGGQQINLNRS